MANTVTLSTGNLTIPLTYGVAYYPATHPPISSKVYYEVTIAWSEGHNCVGIGYGDKKDHSQYTQLYPYGSCVIIDTIWYSISGLVSPATFGCCLNKETNEIIYYNNGKQIGSYKIPRSSVNYYAAVSNGSSFYYPCNAIAVNFGASSFKYPIPEGYTSYDGNQSNADRYLFKDNEGYKTLTELVSTECPTENQFLEKGMRVIPSYNQIDRFTELITYSKNKLKKGLVHFKPKDKMILSSTDIHLSKRALKKVSLTGSDMSKVLFSKDSGMTWHNKTEVIPISNISTQGLTLTQLAAITPAEWKSFLDDAHVLRFAFYLPDETANTDKLELIVDFIWD